MGPSAALISAELAQFMRGPVSAMLGTSDAMAVPDATRVAGVAAIDACRLRVLISPDARTARANAVVGARVAVLVTNILTYRSVQWKGRVVAAEETRTLLALITSATLMVAGRRPGASVGGSP